MAGYLAIIVIALAVLIAVLEVRRRRQRAVQEQFSEAFAERLDRQRYEPPPSPVPVDVSGEDETDLETENAPYGTGLGLALGIEYVDAAGVRTRRRVTIIAADTEYLKAFCHERRAFRTFRIDRVTGQFAARTGECIDLLSQLPRIVAEQAAARAARKEATRRARTEGERMIREAEARAAKARKLRAALLDRVQDGADVLIYLARSDGELHPQEAAVVRSYVEQRRQRYKALADIPDVVIDGVVADLEARWPTPEMAAAAIARIAAERQRVHRRLLAQCAVEIVAADGKITPAEREFVAELEGWLKRV